MQIFIEPATCDICGTEGLGRPGTVADQWCGARIVHHDLDVCREALSNKDRKLQEKIKNLEAKLS